MSGVIEVAEIPSGTVTLSDRRTQRRWSVRLPRFELATVPVTRSQYSMVAGSATGPQVHGPLPVVDISWHDAIDFCNALSHHEGLTPAYETGPGEAEPNWNRAADGYRLPTEAEWEYACRAGSSGPRYGDLEDIAWYRRNSHERVHEVGRKEPNAWGLYDLLGNVWEWCWDLYDPDVYGSYRVLRGGGWFDEHWSCRASVRRRSHPTFITDDLGFRVARSVPAD
ncbi:formylglycine-generating enzyme family protein [Nocardioidaceae bacterium SCSIO 66511]|nr:formylglycine-generating enzyme family protein [Nocardioidaceae bacterium SCSIO 66511]